MTATRELLAARHDAWGFLAEPYHLSDWWPGIVSVQPDRRGFADGARWQVTVIADPLRIGPLSFPRAGRPRGPSASQTLVITAIEPEHRWSTAHDVMLQLQWIAEGGSMAGVPAPVVARRKNREKLAWALLAAAVAAAAALGYGFVRRAPQPAPLVRFDLAPPPEIATMDVPRTRRVTVPSPGRAG